MDHHQESLAARIAFAAFVRTDIERFTQEFPDLGPDQALLPIMSWDQLERQLTHLALDPEMREVAPARISAMRKLASNKPGEMVLQDILIEAWLLLDERFEAALQEGEMT